MYGLVSGNRHDSFLLSKSGLLNKLQQFMPVDAPEDIEAVIYSWYGDPAYPQSIHILGVAQILLMALLKLIGIVKCHRFVRVLIGALHIFLHNGHFWISGLQRKSFRFLLHNIIFLLLSLSIFQPVSMATKP